MIGEYILKHFNRIEIEANKASFHRRERYFLVIMIALTNLKRNGVLLGKQI